MNLDSRRPVIAPTGLAVIFNQSIVGAGLCARPFFVQLRIVMVGNNYDLAVGSDVGIALYG